MSYRKIKIACACMTVLMAMSACSKKLDFRNAEISNNKVYSAGENEPFSGSVTNFPISKMPVGGINPVANTYKNITNDAMLIGLVLMNGPNTALLCDVSISSGVLDGDALCRIRDDGRKAFKLSFKNNLLDGEVKFFDVNGKGDVVAEAIYQEGSLNGEFKILSAKSGKIIYTVSWKKGFPDGDEKILDEETGKVTFTGTFVNGKYEGETVRYSSDGTVIARSQWKDGVQQKDNQPNQVANEACSDQWIKAFRKESGEDAIISNDQLNEWEANCRAGQRPSSMQ